MGFHPEEQVRAYSKQYPHQGNDKKSAAITRYNKQGSDLGFSPRSPRPGTREALPNPSHPMMSPPLAAIPAAAYTHGPDVRKGHARTSELISRVKSCSPQHIDDEEGHYPMFGTLWGPCNIVRSGNRWLICIRRHATMHYH